MPGSSHRAPFARERRHRHGGVAHGFRAAAVGDHAVDDRAVELVQVAELFERFGDRVVGELALRHRIRVGARSRRARDE